VSETQELRLELKWTREVMEKERKVQQQYEEKMKRHRALTEEVEQASPVQQELEGLRKKISNLKERSEIWYTNKHLLRGDCCSEGYCCFLQGAVICRERVLRFSVERNRELCRTRLPQLKPPELSWKKRAGNCKRGYPTMHFL